MYSAWEESVVTSSYYKTLHKNGSKFIAILQKIDRPPNYLLQVYHMNILGFYLEAYIPTEDAVETANRILKEAGYFDDKW